MLGQVSWRGAKMTLEIAICLVVMTCSVHYLFRVASGQLVDSRTVISLSRVGRCLRGQLNKLYYEISLGLSIYLSCILRPWKNGIKCQIKPNTKRISTPAPASPACSIALTSMTTTITPINKNKTWQRKQPIYYGSCRALSVPMTMMQSTLLVFLSWRHLLSFYDGTLSVFTTIRPY